MTITIEKNIPIPTGRRESALTIALKSMAIGDSALLTWEQYRGIHSYAKNAGIKVKARINNGEYRIWRIS